ncbi:PREDICTED: uncharacterized protein LOC104811375 [Tarenaya hassleriana]|uniref:uncharacterized protein LOC104811375 n=1 Tax=Tarenaya hassleriana TaxID=28532 RepID=UPI00053C218B|nr:PREDICTED: uncharacterized protein LOC104811375 [Tarenaya hassleriana]
MGSLMAGWDSPVDDPKTVKRTKSFTKEEIEAFWRLKKKTEEEHLQAISKLLDNEDVERKEAQDNTAEGASEKQNNTKGWWRRSSWAFLNEPREAEGRPNNYVPQFDVAHVGKSHDVDNNSAISA